MEGKLILIVEDDPDNQDVLRIVVEEVVGARATLASSGVAALAAVREQGPDLILLNSLLPELSGYEVARLLKADPATQQIPIIAITSQCWPDSCLALAAGCDACIEKPFGVEELAAQVRLYLEQRPLA